MRIKATVDFVFKQLLGSADHPNLTKSFLDGILIHLGLPQVDSLEILNPFSPADYRIGRDIVLDVHVKDTRGREYQIEMQTRIGPWLPRRMIHNAARLFDKAIPKGDDYHTERPVIAIWLLESDLKLSTAAGGPHSAVDQSWFSEYQMRSESGSLLCPDFRMVIIQLSAWNAISITKDLPQLQANRTINLGLKTWLSLFAAHDGVDPEAWQTPKTMPELQEAKHIMAKIDRSVRARIAYWNRFDGEMQARTERVVAREEGLAEGRAEGRAQGAREQAFAIARNMLEHGLSLDTIVQVTGLDSTDVKTLQGPLPDGNGELLP